MRVMQIAVVAAMVLISGCGFYLKGKRPLPPELQDVQITTGSFVESELDRALRTEVERRGGRVSSAPNASRLNVSSVKQKRNVLSLGTNGRAIEYLFTITVTFSLLHEGQAAVPEQSLTTYEEYSFSDREIVSSEHEAREIRDAMYRELAELIMLRIETSLRS